MQEQEYYNEIENYIKKNEVSKRRRILEENYDTLNNYTCRSSGWAIKGKVWE